MKDNGKMDKLGFTYELPKQGLELWKAEDKADALFTFSKFLPYHIKESLKTLENIHCTLDQAQTILNGKSTGGLSIRHHRAIENYALACEYLMQSLEDNTFKIDKPTICKIHSIVARDEVKCPGEFRNNEVWINKSTYVPPHSLKLNNIMVDGFGFLDKKLKDAQEQAICMFLFMAKAQFFMDCNKRTANLMMNGILINAGYQPLTIEKDGFMETISEFYETANATNIIHEINEIARNAYIQVDCESRKNNSENNQNKSETADKSKESPRRRMR